MVWNVPAAAIVANLEDPHAAAGKKRPETGRGVQGLAWVTANPSVLAAVLASGLTVLWDTAAPGAGTEHVHAIVNYLPQQG